MLDELWDVKDHVCGGSVLLEFSVYLHNDQIQRPEDAVSRLTFSQRLTLVGSEMEDLGINSLMKT